MFDHVTFYVVISILKVVSTLTISTVRYMDMGRYRCSADNTVTTVVHSQFAEISVIRKFDKSSPLVLHCGEGEGRRGRGLQVAWTCIRECDLGITSVSS